MRLAMYVAACIHAPCRFDASVMSTVFRCAAAALCDVHYMYLSTRQSVISVGSDCLAVSVCLLVCQACSV